MNDLGRDSSGQISLGRLILPGREGTNVAACPYLLANNPIEAQRLNLQHYIFKEMFGSLILTPIGQQFRNQTGPAESRNLELRQRFWRNPDQTFNVPRRILDIGSGTGRWMVEVARLFPYSQVVGIDIAPSAMPFTDHAPLPTNDVFEKANFLRPLPFPDGSFDYVHLRCVSTGIPAHQWQTVIDEVARVTMPGGWIELSEWELPTGNGPALQRAIGIYEEELNHVGVYMKSIPIIDSFLYHAQPRLTAIRVVGLDIPIGLVGNRLGLLMEVNLRQLLFGLTEYLSISRKLPESDWQDLLKQVGTELLDAQFQPVMALTVAYAQRMA